jgi:transposase-like protein
LIEGEVSRLDAGPAKPRRRWSTSAKEEIVARSMMPVVNVSALARAYGDCAEPGVRLAAEGHSRHPEPERRSDVCHGCCREDHKTDEAGGAVELVVGDVTVRIGADVSPARIAQIVRAIRAA